MNNKNPEVDEYLGRVKKWDKELSALREVILDCQLNETVKWRGPCYTFQGKNTLIIGAFKDYCVLSFLKGVLLKDEEGILEAPGENSRSVRIVKITSVEQVVILTPTLKAYIYEALELEKAGLRVEKPKESELELPEELIVILNENPALKNAFDQLTPGRKRGYNMHFTSAKQSKTRISRIEKVIPKILAGKGMNDCTCGMSKRLPNCDGSHKHL